MDHLFQTATKFAPQLLILMFLAITFLQSGIDKISDWNGNLSFLKDHFKKTFLRNTVPLMLGVILFGEIVVGFLSIGFYAAVIAAKILLLLLFGQRVAKDYAGAMTITVYFMVTVFGVYIML